MSKNKKDMAELLSSQGIEFINKGEYDKAIDMFNKAIDLEPDNIIHKYEKSISYYKKKLFDSTIKILLPLRTHKDVNAQVFQMLGNCYDRVGKKDSAEAVLKEGINSFPNSGRIYFELGVLESDREQFREAKYYWEKGVEVDPQYAMNYLYLFKIHTNTSEKLSAFFFAEYFINLSDNLTIISEVSKNFFDTYKKVFYSSDSTFNFNITSVRKVTNDTSATGLPYQQVFQNLYIKNASKILKKHKEKNSLTIKELTEIRKAVLKGWFENDLSKKYKNEIMEFQKRVLDAGVFEPYNYWLFKDGNPKEFDSWLQKNDKSLNKFIEWIEKNQLRITNQDTKK